jgi:hypothetical protein
VPPPPKCKQQQRTDSERGVPVGIDFKLFHVPVATKTPGTQPHSIYRSAVAYGSCATAAI